MLQSAESSLTIDPFQTTSDHTYHCMRHSGDSTMRQGSIYESSRLLVSLLSEAVVHSKVAVDALSNVHIAVSFEAPR